MARQVVWSPRARSDARLAIEYIKEEAPEAARRFAAALIQASRSLSELAERGRAVPELEDPAVRELILARHRLVYEILEDRVAILRVIHASRDLRKAWGRR